MWTYTTTDLCTILTYIFFLFYGNRHKRQEPFSDSLREYLPHPGQWQWSWLTQCLVLCWLGYSSLQSWVGRQGQTHYDSHRSSSLCTPSHQDYHCHTQLASTTQHTNINITTCRQPVTGGYIYDNSSFLYPNEIHSSHFTQFTSNKDLAHPLHCTWEIISKCHYHTLVGPVCTHILEISK